MGLFTVDSVGAVAGPLMQVSLMTNLQVFIFQNRSVLDSGSCPTTYF